MILKMKNPNLRACEHIIEMKNPNSCKDYEHSRYNMLTIKNM